MTPPAAYYPEYQPEDPERFAQMAEFFGLCQTKEQLVQAQVLFIMDMSYPRQDIVVAAGRVERERGWR